LVTDEEFLDGNDLWQQEILGMNQEFTDYEVNTMPFTKLLLPQLSNTLLDSCTNWFGIEDNDDLFVSFIFVRKYSANTRAELVLHSDSSKYTVSIQLNDGFNGGIFEIFDHETSQRIDSIEPDYGFRSNSNANRILNENQIRNPFQIQLKQGHAIVHKGSLYHRINPISNGTRYSLLIFIDSKSSTQFNAPHFDTTNPT